MSSTEARRRVGQGHPTRPLASERPPFPLRGEGFENAFAPVLGYGRFTQPGADGGDTRDVWHVRRQ
jgi:hypothetical protein